MLSFDASAVVIFAFVWILVLVLGKILFKPITRILDARSGAATPRSSPKRS